jgi:hypothetical protein
MWRTEDIVWDCTDNMVAAGGTFVPVSELGLLYVCGDGSGELQATIKQGNTDYEAKSNGPWSLTVVSSGPRLFGGKRGIDARIKLHGLYLNHNLILTNESLSMQGCPDMYQIHISAVIDVFDLYIRWIMLLIVIFDK